MGIAAVYHAVVDRGIGCFLRIAVASTGWCVHAPGCFDGRRGLCHEHNARSHSRDADWRDRSIAKPYGERTYAYSGRTRKSVIIRSTYDLVATIPVFYRVK